MYIENSTFCRICQENLPDRILSCDHRFCQDCLDEYLHLKISEADVNKINCPECEIPIYDEYLQNLLTRSYLKKYNEIKEKKKMTSHKLFKYCPKSNCKGFDVATENKNRLKCVVCGYSFCFVCLNELLEEPCLNCKPQGKNLNNLKFFAWRLVKNVKKCPGCKFFIWKDGGCNNMTCDKCQLRWCWICGYQGPYHGKLKCLLGPKIYDLHWEFLILSLFSPVTLLFSFFLFIRYKIRTDSARDSIKNYPVFSYFWSFLISPPFFPFLFGSLLVFKAFKKLYKIRSDPGFCWVFTCVVLSLIFFVIFVAGVVCIYCILAVILPPASIILIITKVFCRLSSIRY